MNFSKINQINLYIKNYENLKKEKERINGEFTQLTDSYYTFKQSDNDSAEYLEEERRRLKEIQVKGAEIASINDSIAVYDATKLEQVSEYIDNFRRYGYLSEEMQTAVKLSKKSKRPMEEMVAIKDAEGRVKYIEPDLAEEFRNLVEEKKACHDYMYKKYTSINNIEDIFVPKMSEAEKIETPVLNESISVEPNAIEIPEEIDSYESLSDEDKLKETNDRIIRIINEAKKPGKGKKRYTTIEGEKMDFPISLLGIYHATKAEQRKLTGNLEAVKIENEQPIIQNPVVQEPAKNEVDGADKIVPVTPTEPDQNDIEVPYSIYPTELATDEIEIPIKLDITPEEIIRSVRKPKTNMFSKIKKHAKALIAAACALAVAASVLVGSYLLRPSENDKVIDTPTNEMVYVIDSNDIHNDVVIETNVNPSDIEHVGEGEYDAGDIVIGDNDLISQNSSPAELPTTIEDNSVDFNDSVSVENTERTSIAMFDTVNIKEGAPIFVDSYKAKNNEQPLNPYFGYEGERTILGICYEVNGSIAFLNAQDPNYSAKQNELEANGAKISSYLVSFKGMEDKGYEGFYRIDDVVKNVNDLEMNSGRSL